MNVEKLKNVQNIISVEETDYEVKTEIQRGWFSNKNAKKKQRPLPQRSCSTMESHQKESL